MTISFMELEERFAPMPLMPKELAMQQSRWRQRWGLPACEVHSLATDWNYHIDPVVISPVAISGPDPDDPWQRLRYALLHGHDRRKYFLTGTRGAGKSTLAYSLTSDSEVTERFHVLAFSITNYLNLADTDAGQVLAVMLAHLIAAIKDAQPEADLNVGEARKALKELHDALAKARPGIKLDKSTINVFGFSSMHLSESQGLRDSYRQYVDGHFDALMGLFDNLVGILEGYRQKKVLLVIDDLDHIDTPDIHHDLFHVQLPMLLRPRCAVLYTFPLDLSYNPDFAHLKNQPNYHVLGNVKLLEAWDSDELCESGRTSPPPQVAWSACS